MGRVLWEVPGELRGHLHREHFGNEGGHRAEPDAMVPSPSIKQVRLTSKRAYCSALCMRVPAQESVSSGTVVFCCVLGFWGRRSFVYLRQGLPLEAGACQRARLSSHFYHRSTATVPSVFVGTAFHRGLCRGPMFLWQNLTDRLSHFPGPSKSVVQPS